MQTTRAHRRALVRVIVVAELVLALVTGVGVAFAYHHIDRQISPGDRVDHHATRQGPRLPTSALNILLMGLDGRSCARCGIDHERGEGGSDTTMLIHVVDGRRSAYAISIPRDTLVDRPACTSGATPVPAATGVPWNQAFALGGPACTVEQLEAVTGIYVDDYIAVDFGGFHGMVDAIGGVEVCVPQPVDDPVAHIHFDAGTQVLDGRRALQYVRERHSTANSDLGRMKRQQAFVASMVNKVLSAGTLTRPDKLYSFADALAGSVRTDPELASVRDLVGLVGSLKHADLQHIRFVTAPTTDFPVGDPRWGRLQLTPEARGLWQKVIDDEPLGALGRGAITAKRPQGSKATAATNGLCG